ncbi:MAG: hypothetical protein K2J36_03800 [Ruminococcus sp.]|nr:hypothetical protein [Ruminococcus sp.]
MRWYKAQKELENRLADCLKERVCYNFDGLEYDKYIMAFRITVDGKTWFETNDKLWKNKVLEYGSQHTKPKYNSYWGLTSEARCYGVVMVAKETGTVGLYITEDIIQKYLNIYKIDKCLNHDNYFFRVLAVLDHRTGRRKIKQLLKNIDSEPEWFRKYITLRAEAQNIY